MSTLSRRGLVFGATILSLGVAATVAVSGASVLSSDDNGTPAAPVMDQMGGSGPAAIVPKFYVGQAGSLTTTWPWGAETAINVVNDGLAARRVFVEWYYGAGGAWALAGTSGPVTINPGTMTTFATSNNGEAFQPFVTSSFFAPRDTTAEFQGRAVVFADPGDTFPGLGVQAVYVSGLGTGISQEDLPFIIAGT